MMRLASLARHWIGGVDISLKSFYDLKEHGQVQHLSFYSNSDD